MAANLTSSLGESRDEIVQQLRARGRVSADELAAVLGVSKQCVRKHLDVLERDGSDRLTQWNCPQAEVARDYRQLCDQELSVYRRLLGAEVVRESRIAGGAPSCVYRVLRPEKAG